VGIDYFGPFYVGQKRRIVKCYGAMFTCLAVRAVHKEISYTLDTDYFRDYTDYFFTGRAPVCCAGGRGFEPQTGPTLRVLK